MRIFMQTETGSLGAPVESSCVPRVGDFAWHTLGEFKVLSISWYMFGDETVTLLVEACKKTDK